jgi:CHAT domain-containing protein
LPRRGLFRFDARTSWRSCVATAFAVGLLAVTAIVAVRHLAAKTPLEGLIAACDRGQRRPVEGPLSGGFAYRVWQADAPSDQSRAWQQRIVAAAAAIPKLSADDTLHALGVTRLMLGRRDAAVETLQRAAAPRLRDRDLAATINTSASAERLGDLSVALLARGTADHTPSDLVWAAEAAQAAWALRRTPETAWNRAATVETLPLRRPSIATWQDYLALDASSGWSGEARSRLGRLRAPTAGERWKQIRRTFEKADAPPSLVAAAARDFPQQSREFIEEILGGPWAATGDRRAFDLARSLAIALDRYGDTLSRRAIAAIETSPPESRAVLRQGFSAFSAGRRQLRGQQMQQAAATLGASSATLAQCGNPFRARVELFRATAEYYTGDFDVARGRLQALLSDRNTVSTSPSLAGQAHWVLGLMHVTRGEWNEGLLEYAAAAGAFDAAGERENRAAIHGLRAELLIYVASTGEAWPELSAAMTDLFVLGRGRRTHAALYQSAAAATALGAHRVALLYASELVANAELDKDPVSIADALIARAPVAATAKQPAAAMRDLQRARDVISSINDAAMRYKSERNLDVAETRVLRDVDPERSRAAATRAIAKLRTTGDAARLPELHFERALAASALHRPADVVADCSAAIAAAEAQRLSLKEHDRRRTFLDRWNPMFALAIATLVDTGQHETAFRYAEQSRGRSFVGERTGTIRYADVSAALPPGTALIEYAVTEEQLVTWVLTSDEAVVRRTRISRQTLESLAARMRQAVAARDRERFDSGAELAYRLMIEPVERVLPEKLIIVPDGILFQLPFAALRSPETGRRLIEAHELMISPSSVAMLERTGKRNRSRLGTDSMAIIGNTDAEDGGFAPLPAARREIDAVAKLYPAATLLSGRNATRANVLSVLRRSTSAHFAGHTVRGIQAATAALVLSREPAKNDFGYLYPSEIERCNLVNVKLIVLAGCATAGGALSSDGPSGIARAFLAAGVQSVIATQWEVDDGLTLPLMIELHRRLRGGERPAAALRAAQVAALVHRSPDSLFTWSAFHLISFNTEGERSHD